MLSKSLRAELLSHGAWISGDTLSEWKLAFQIDIAIRNADTPDNRRLI